MGVKFADADGKPQPVFFGSYGIGISRLMGVIVEKMSDERGLVWPEEIAPARVYLMSLGDDKKYTQLADQLYKQLRVRGVSVIYDDRLVSAGEKLADADLLGIPHRVVVSPKIGLKHCEYKARTLDVAEVLSPEALFEKIS
jgi:prolyl-tRNA synthetase